VQLQEPLSESIDAKERQTTAVTLRDSTRGRTGPLMGAYHPDGALPLRGRLDWIGGFSLGISKTLDVNAYLTPVQHGLIPIGTLNERFPTSGNVQVRPARIRSIATLTPGSCYSIEKSQPNLLDGSDSGGRIRSDFERTDLVFNFQDKSSSVVTYPQLSSKYPQIAEVINTWLPCPDDVAFFVARDQGTTVVIPTVSILQACYMPTGTLLGDFLMAKEPRPFSSEKVMFDGFRFASVSVYQEPHMYFMRAARNIRRAEREIAQLLPRAVAHHRRYRTGLPILIRPPFTGKTRIVGRVIRGGICSDILFFPRECTFSSSVDHWEWVNRRSEPKSFAPHLDIGSVRLDVLRGVLEGRRFDIYDAICDIRKFPLIEERLAWALANRCVRDPSFEWLRQEHLTELRAWCYRFA
jgi:hypothetical protein